FSQNCTVRSNDEIGTLAASINHMSDELSGNMEKLITANSILKEDLARQQETDRIRRQFISDVSHDFKTPLTLIVSYAEALEGMQQQEQGREFCEIIADEGNRLSLMVGRLLKLSRLESGMEAVELSVFCLSEILDDAIRTYRLPMEKKQLQVVRDYSGQTVVRADYQKIEQVVLNLLENAVKYTPNGMKIRVSTEMVEGQQCRITAENEGSHIDEGELQNIFISFYRADKSRERALQSYGLGLAIVKTIMELHGADFGVENTQDGVRFWFLLPTVTLEEPESP
ncbi:MAG: HAMP domain-containing sensor histidine kinase, partial [Angelakisella sp.]